MMSNMMNNKKISLLVVEDDAHLSEVYQMKFEKIEYDAKVVRSGREAFDVLAKFNPDVIVLDLVMEEIDGFEVLLQLKKNKKWSNIPVIIVSNLGQQANIDEAMSLGAAEYVIKSDSTLKNLVHLIEKYALHN